MATQNSNAARKNVPASSNKPAAVVAKPQLRAIPADETFSSSVRRLDPTTLEVRFAVRPDRSTTTRYEVLSVVDFKHAPPQEVQELCCRPIVIELQRKWRDLFATNKDAALAPATFAKCDVKSDIIDAARRNAKSADPVAKATAALAKLSPDERAALLASLANSK